MAGKRKVYEMALSFGLSDKQAEVRKKINDSLTVIDKGNFGIVQVVIQMSDITGISPVPKPIKRARKPRPVAEPAVGEVVA